MNTYSTPVDTRPPRKGDGGTYVLVAQESRDFDMALKYAAHICNARRAKLLVLAFATLEGFTDWSGVEARMKQEAETALMQWLKPKLEFCALQYGTTPAVDIRFGQDPFKLVAEGVKACPDAVALILGAATGQSGPGYMVDHYSGKGLRDIGMPVILVPDSLQHDFFEKIA